jgi:hypothetical protein
MPVLLSLAVVALAGTALQQPDIRNGRLETRASSGLSRDVAALGSGPDPVWLAWQVPMVAGDWHLCASWNDGWTSAHGEWLEGRSPGQAAGTGPLPTGPIRLESGTRLIVLARIVAGRLERLRAVSGDCPIDAGGRAVFWLTGVTPDASARYLDELTRQGPLSVHARRRTAESALSALSFHQGTESTAALGRLSRRPTDAALRRLAARALATTRGAEGFDAVQSLLDEETDAGLRRGFVAALGQSPDERALGVLLQRARSDDDPAVRGEAAYAYVRRTGTGGLAIVLGLVDGDPDDSVKRRIVAGIASLSDGAGLQTLTSLAQSHASLAVRKEALSALGRSRHPAALSILEAILEQ